ncbi:MAG: hypothetical protein HY738_16045 [Bacteroidia bacterium]|nr:hypothetical protein [Bacteroidia bacterium]
MSSLFYSCVQFCPYKIFNNEIDKWEMQNFWWEEKRAVETIENFFTKSKGECLIHDLMISFKLIDKYMGLDLHSFDVSGIEILAQEYSKYHVVERIRRFVCESLQNIDKNKSNDKSNFNKILDEIKTVIDDKNFLNLVIVKNIQAIGNTQEFFNRFSKVGCMDYSLRFFQKIVKRVIVKIKDDEKYRTGWIRREDGYLDKDILTLSKVNAQFIVDNYTATIIKILGYLLFREKSFDSLKNFEFEDAGNRLTDEKIDKIISLEGPSRTNNSIQLILQTIFVY